MRDHAYKQMAAWGLSDPEAVDSSAYHALFDYLAENTDWSGGDPLGDITNELQALAHHVQEIARIIRRERLIQRSAVVIRDCIASLDSLRAHIPQGAIPPDGWVARSHTFSAAQDLLEELLAEEGR